VQFFFPPSPSRFFRVMNEADPQRIPRRERPLFSPPGFFPPLLSFFGWTKSWRQSLSFVAAAREPQRIRLLNVSFFALSLLRNMRPKESQCCRKNFFSPEAIWFFLKRSKKPPYVSEPGRRFCLQLPSVPIPCPPSFSLDAVKSAAVRLSYSLSPL